MNTPGDPSPPVQNQDEETRLSKDQSKEVLVNGNLVTKSWATVAGKPYLSKFDYEVSLIDGKAIVPVPVEVLEDAPPLWEDFLVGRFASVAPHVAKIHVIVNKIWNLGDRSIKIDVFEVNATTVKFRIRNASARNRALRRGMWNICQIPMMVSKWSPIAEDAQPEITSMPMWVTIKNVPHSMFSWKGLSFLASPVGIPIRLHRETELVTNFDEAKIFVDVDLSKDLPRSYFFEIKGEEVNVTFEYPWLPLRCGVCRKWGHTEEGCFANLGRTTGVNLSVSSPSEGSPNDAITNMQSPNMRSDNQQGSESRKPELAVPMTTSPGKQDFELAVVETYVSGTMTANLDREEGEIISTVNTEQLGEGKEVMEDTTNEEWSVVSPKKSCRSSDKTQKSLESAQVTYHASRFSVLEEEAEDHGLEEAEHIEKEQDDMTSNQTDQKEDLETQKKGILTKRNIRVVLPRSSKSAHKILSENPTQKAKVSAPSNSNRRTSKNSH